MKQDKIRRIASGILKVGGNKVWLNPDEKGKIEESMTKDDVRGLIKEGLVKKIRGKGHSRARARLLHEKKKKGRKKGLGKRTGSKKARMKKKERWIASVRAQRKELKKLKGENKKLTMGYGKIYRMIKGNYFKGRKYVRGMAEREQK